MNNILKAQLRINKYINKTELQFSERLSKIYNANIFLKREDLQKTRSFKIRGALNKIINIKDMKNGIVCASAGNHAQGVAFSSKLLDINCDIYIPQTTPLQKVNSINKYNINLYKYGYAFNETLKKAIEYSIEKNKVFIHPYDDIDIIYGQGTIGLEILDEITPDIIVSCVAGGGLISGISLSCEKENIDIIGIEPVGCANLYHSLKSNKIVKLKNFDNFVDGASVESIGELNYNICKKNIKNVFTVSNPKICYEMVNLYQEDGIIVEPAGALSIAGLEQIPNIKNKTIVCIISGGNNDLLRYPEITEYALQYKNKKFYFLIQFNQIPGELKNFVYNILDSNDDITRFEYIKKNNKNYGGVFIGIETDNIDYIKKKMDNYNIKYNEINEKNELYKILI